jgi:hypothetical protein
MMSSEQDSYLVDVVSGECSFYNVVMVARQLASGYIELSCSQGIYFDIDDSLMQECTNRFNEYYDDEVFERGYAGFTIETDLTIYISPEALEQLDTDRMSVILGGECRLQTCDDKSGREYDVSETAFADKFNEHFVHMLDTFDDVCNFKVKSIKKL